ncbi:unnamed protein product [Ambrosiozyma monospora]|uniref:Unnamed protein product n=1 Tax=Ambrosiozyma monospora TaxID=43982 RepID=A0ACB5TA45_AMBMO|nr:unnamed protein product [Ambrosiozyma monospora]
MLEKSSTQKPVELIENLQYELIANLMINYSVYKTNTNLKHWVIGLGALTDYSQKLIFARKPVDKLIVLNPEDDSDDEGSGNRNGQSGNSTDRFGGDLAFDSNLFGGFIKDPKNDGASGFGGDGSGDVEMTDAPGKTVRNRDEVSFEGNADLYISNLLVLIKLNEDQVTGNLITKIMNNLNK